MDVLIIEDCKEYRELLSKNISKKKGVKTEESGCLKDALEKIKTKKYDIILLDLSLPECDGMDTIKSIKTEVEKNKASSHIIIITGYEDYKIGKEAFDLGIKDFLIKDEINLKDILRSVEFSLLN